MPSTTPVNSAVTGFTPRIAIDNTPQRTEVASPAGTFAELSPTGRIEISGAGRALSAQSTQQGSESRYEDIESSNLPDEIKRVLEMIRDIKAQLQEQQKQMAQIMADNSLDEATKKSRLDQVQAMINGLSSALMSATGVLGKLMQEQNLDQEQAMQVMTLMSK